MELKLDSNSKSAQDMKKCHKLMKLHFGKEIVLVNYYGPVQMGVFGLEYQYLPESLTLYIESERGIITLKTVNQTKKTFYPSMIFQETDYYHMSDSEKDIEQLIILTHKAIKEQLITFE